MRFAIIVLAGFIVGCGTFGPVDVPEQSQFPPLARELAKEGPFVRLYATEVGPFQAFAVHLAFVVKFANSSTIEKWELHPKYNTEAGHVKGEPITDIPALVNEMSGAYVVADAFSDQAAAIGEFIHTQSVRYPCRLTYAVFGPNSNTYIAWILQQTGWHPPLPGRAIGRDAATNCP